MLHQPLEITHPMHVLVMDWDCWKVVLNGGLGYTDISRDAQPSHGHLQIHCMATITSTNFSFGNWCFHKAGTSHSYVEAFVVIRTKTYQEPSKLFVISAEHSLELLESYFSLSCLFMQQHTLEPGSCSQLPFTMHSASTKQFVKH